MRPLTRLQAGVPCEERAVFNGSLTIVLHNSCVGKRPACAKPDSAQPDNVDSEQGRESDGLSMRLSVLQGFGGPCCARILTSWFATKERGTYWGMWNIAHNLGGFGAPILAGTAARYYGWKWGQSLLHIPVDACVHNRYFTLPQQLCG